MSIRSDLSIRTVALGTSRKNLRTLNQNLHLRRPYRYDLQRLKRVAHTFSPTYQRHHPTELICHR